MAPAPIASASADHCGAKARLPTDRPMTAGPPASRVSPTKEREAGAPSEWGRRCHSFGDVVQRGAEDQESAKPRRARCEGGANGEPFAELCRPSPNAIRSPARALSARLAAADGHQQEEASGSGRTTIVGPWNSAAASPASSSASSNASTSRKASRPTVSASRKSIPFLPTPLNAG